MIIIIILLLFFQINTKEFLYPVEATKDNKNIYVIYQKNIYHLELWLLNIKTNIATKCLMSSFNPAGIKLIPEDNGFSFIDNGHLKIKETDKPVFTFDFKQPIYDFHVIEWLNESICYFSARFGKRFCIFLCDKNSRSLKMLIERDFCTRVNEDFMYPQIIDDKVYFISKSVHKVADSNYEIFGNYKILCSQFNRQEKTANSISEIVLRLGEKAIAFLKMTSNEEGYFIEHPNKISKHEKLMNLKYFHLEKIDSEWQCNKLFSFKIPLHFLMNKSDFRLYESIIPFLPKHFDKKIYYSNSIEENYQTNIFEYDISNKTCKQIIHNEYDNLLFPPIKIENELFFGGAIENEKIPNFFEEQQKIKINLPKKYV